MPHRDELEAQLGTLRLHLQSQLRRLIDVDAIVESLAMVPATERGLQHARIIKELGDIADATVTVRAAAAQARATAQQLL
jgi:hypothetical protein